jgi:hypothetical protein
MCGVQAGDLCGDEAEEEMVMVNVPQIAILQDYHGRSMASQDDRPELMDLWSDASREKKELVMAPGVLPYQPLPPLKPLDISPAARAMRPTEFYSISTPERNYHHAAEREARLELRREALHVDGGKSWRGEAECGSAPAGALSPRREPRWETAPPLADFSSQSRTTYVEMF